MPGALAADCRPRRAPLPLTAGLVAPRELTSATNSAVGGVGGRASLQSAQVAWEHGRMSRASLEKKPAEVASMFDGIAARYDLTNDLISMGQDRRWRRLTVDAVAAMPGERVLDLAAGTGTSSEPFAADG